MQNNLAKQAGDLLTRKNLTLAIAESCTGGLLGHLITSISGSSVYFRGGIVAYSNDIKTSILGLDAELLTREGAVSESVAATMAEKVMEKLTLSYLAGGHEVNITASIGVAVFPLHSRDTEVLIEKADIAMYYAKKHGKNSYALFSPTML